MSEPWARVMDRHTPLSALPDLVDQWTAWAVDNLRLELAADPDLTADQRAAIVVRATPMIYAQTEKAFIDAWLSFQPKQ